MTISDFNTRASQSNIGSKSPIQSSQYKHSREYDHRYYKPIITTPKRGMILAITIGPIIWGLIVYAAFRIF